MYNEKDKKLCTIDITVRANFISLHIVPRVEYYIYCILYVDNGS